MRLCLTEKFAFQRSTLTRIVSLSARHRGVQHHATTRALTVVVRTLSHPTPTPSSPVPRPVRRPSVELEGKVHAVHRDDRPPPPSPGRETGAHMPHRGYIAASSPHTIEHHLEGRLHVLARGTRQSPRLPRRPTRVIPAPGDTPYSAFCTSPHRLHGWHTARKAYLV